MEQKELQPIWTATYLQTSKAMYYLEPLKEFAQNRQRKQVALKVADLQEQGTKILLPYALCIDAQINERITHKGRAIVPPVASLDGTFTQVQSSPYKINHPFDIHTYLWQVNGCKGLVYGTIGLTARDGKTIVENGDLLLIKASTGMLKVWVFKGLAGWYNGLPAGLTKAVEVLKGLGQI